MTRGARLGRGRPNRPIIERNMAVQRGGTKALVVTGERSRRKLVRHKPILVRNATAVLPGTQPLVVTPKRDHRRLERRANVVLIRSPQRPQQLPRPGGTVISALAPRNPRQGQSFILRAPAAPVIPPVTPDRRIAPLVSRVRARAIALRHPVITRGGVAPSVATGDASFTFGTMSNKWGFQMLTLRVSSLNKGRVDIAVRADSGGLPYDPTAAVAQMAFIPSALDNPSSGDWKTCNWDVTRIGTYVMQCLVGPGGTVNLATGGYYVWAKLTDAASGETPVEQVARLFVD